MTHTRLHALFLVALVASLLLLPVPAYAEAIPMAGIPVPSNGYPAQDPDPQDPSSTLESAVPPATAGLNSVGQLTDSGLPAGLATALVLLASFLAIVTMVVVFLMASSLLSQPEAPARITPYSSPESRSYPRSPRP